MNSIPTGLKVLSISSLRSNIKFLDNPLLCDCELQWYRNWLRTLKDKDDEMMQKKRTVCTMQQEHREYTLQGLPLEKMNCVIKSYEASTNRAEGRNVDFLLQVVISICVISSYTQC